MRVHAIALIQFDSDMAAGAVALPAAREAINVVRRVAPDEGVHPWQKFLPFFMTIRSTATRPKYARDDIPKIDHYPDGMTDADAEQDRLQAGRIARQRLRRAWACASSWKRPATRWS